MNVFYFFKKRSYYNMERPKTTYNHLKTDSTTAYNHLKNTYNHSQTILNRLKQDAGGAYIWAWSYYAYDTLNMPYCS